MKRVLFGLAVSSLLAGAISCAGLFEPDQLVVLGVSKLEAPAAITAGTPLTAVITVETGGCTSFDHLEVTRNASTASLTAWGIDASKGEKGIACPAVLFETPHSQNFDPPFQSPFTIQVQRGRLSPLVTTVQVQ